MIRKILLTIFISLCFFCGFSTANAASDTTIYFFWGQGCPHCAKEELFLEDLKNKYPQIVVRDYEVWNSAENQKLLADLGKKLDIQIKGVPFTIIGDKYFSGWLNEETTGASIEEAVKYSLESGCRDLVGEITNATTTEPDGQGCSVEPGKKGTFGTVNVPFAGKIDLETLSLPVIAVVLGALDGFNPCAMWTLIFLIGLLLGMKDRKRMWILGGAFIFASAFVYFLFMSAWLNLLLFIGMIFWVRLAIAGVALFGGGYNLKKYFDKQPAVCKTGTDPKQQKVFENLKKIAHRENFYLALGGIILLAFAVNLVELICSAGLPALFAQILAMSGLAAWQYYAYILLYIFVFMLDDMVVFFTAMITLRLTGITTKYQRASHLIGGILMLMIGILLIFRPEWLTFG